jgi:putative CocE/NonD family hydrolase
VHDPWRPAPSRGGHLGPAPGLVERADLDGRADVACFQTSPLAQPLRLCGRPRLRLLAAADQPGFDLWVCLSVVQADRRVLQLSTGVCRVLGERALQLQPLDVALQPMALELAAGERLRLSLAGAAWPAIAVNPGDGTPPRSGPGPDHRVISINLPLETALLWLEPLLPPQIGAN